MKIDLNIDTKSLEERFRLSEKNVLYATVNAINKVALIVQKQEQQNVKSRLHLRGGSGEQLILRSVAKIQPFANIKQGRLYAEIFIDQPKPRMLLIGLELGGVKTSQFGGNVAIPLTGSAARPSMDDPVPKNLQITSLQLKPSLTSAQRKERRNLKGSTPAETRAARAHYTQSVGQGHVWKGKQRTYMIPGVGIFQRSGPKKTDSRLIYKFKPSPALKPTLQFRKVALASGDSLLHDELQAAVIAELQR